VKKKFNIIKNLLIINLKIFYSIYFLKKKIIFFFNPKSKLANVTTYYIKDWLSNLKKDFYVIYGYVPGEHHNNKITLPAKACKFIFGVDIFISTYVCEYFSKNSKRIYIHHDIYDSPLTKKKNLIQLVEQLLEYDYIFTPSKISAKMFKNIFIDSKNEPEIIDTGYLKLDYLLKKNKKKKLKKNSIIIAPTDFKAFKKYSLVKKLPELIDILIKRLNIQIIFRPHPSNRDSIEVLNINKKFSKFKRFKLDISENYLNTYKKCFCMITDISGTAYTYAFLNKSPVIFLSNNIIKEKIINYNYIKDRTKIGYVAKNLKELLNKIKLINENKNKFNKSIFSLKNNLSNLYSVKKIMTKKIYEIAYQK
jgi:hypothetical protein